MARNSLVNIAKLLDSVSTPNPPEVDFLRDLKRSIELSNAKESRKPSQTYKPSSLKCIRNMYYQVSGANQDDGQSSYSMVGIRNSGADIHERTQKYVADMINNNIDCEYIDVGDYVKSRELTYLDIVSKNGMETKLYHKDLNMSFLCDGIIKYKGHYYILELKTESSFKWMARQGVDPSHYNQGTAYSLAFGINEVIFVYISRDVLDMKSYMFVPTQEQKDILVNKIHMCDAFIDMGVVPPIPEDISNKTCSYCDYRTLCKKTP